jgi:hypothetical protein
MSEPIGERTRRAARNRASVRRELRIAAPTDDVWAVVGDPTRLAEWFPAVASCAVDGTTRVVTTGSVLPTPEELLNEPPAHEPRLFLEAPV